MVSCKVELVDSDRVVTRWLQDVTEPTNTALSDGAEGVRLACPPTKLLNESDGPESQGVEALDSFRKKSNCICWVELVLGTYHLI